MHYLHSIKDLTIVSASRILLISIPVEAVLTAV